MNAALAHPAFNQGNEPGAAHDHFVYKSRVDLEEHPADLAGLAYIACGPVSGPSVVFLHGFPDAPHAFAPSMRLLADEGYRAVAPWMPGYGPSRLSGPFDLDSLAERLASFTRLVSGRRSALVGHDWGAAVVHQIAARHPDVLTHAVTLSVPHPRVFLTNTVRSPSQLLRSRYMALFQLPLLPERGLNRDGLLRLRAKWSPRFVPDTNYLDVVLAGLGDGAGPLAYYRAMFRPLGDFARRFVETAPSPVPMLYLHGREDGCIHPKIARGQTRYYPAGFREVVLDDVGHFVPLEAPGELCTHLLCWLRKS